MEELLPIIIRFILENLQLKGNFFAAILLQVGKNFHQSARIEFISQMNSHIQLLGSSNQRVNELKGCSLQGWIGQTKNTPISVFFNKQGDEFHRMPEEVELAEWIDGQYLESEIIACQKMTKLSKMKIIGYKRHRIEGQSMPIRLNETNSTKQLKNTRYRL